MATETWPRTRRELMALIGKAGTALAFCRTAPGFAQAVTTTGKPPMPVRIEVPTAQTAAPYGSLLGKPFPEERDAIASFRTPSGMAVWRQELFDVGPGGEPEIAWVIHKGADPIVTRFEKHDLTEQAVIPLTGDLIQIVALSGADEAPDLSTIRAFRLTPGIGLSMGRNIWHASRSKGITLAMLTRGSTSVAMARFQKKEGPISETAFRETSPIRLIDPI